MEERKYELLLAGIIGLRATSYIFSKMLVADMGRFTVLAIRFLIAFTLLALLFHRRLRGLDRKTVTAGLWVGLMFFLTMACELTALTTADSSLVSLLENCAIIFVPVLEAVILRRMPGKTTVRCAALAMLGVVCLALRHGALSGGVVFGLMAALCYAGAILVTHRVSRQAKDNLAVGILQIGTMGVLSLCAALLLEDKPQPMSGEQWAMMAALIIICTGFGFTLQPVAQSRVSAERAGLFCAVSPAVATLLGVVVLGEKIGLLSIAGLLLILSAILLPHLEKRKT